MIPIFGNGDQILVLNILPKGWKFNQSYLMEQVVPSLSRQRRQNDRNKSAPIL
jgi:hypothetical protein